MDKDLIELLDHYLATLIKDAHPYTTIQTILQRLLEKCANSLNIKVERYANKNTIYIHPDNRMKIDLIWQSLNKNKLKHDEINVYKMLKYSDFVNIHDIQKFINILVSKHEMKFLSELLAIDGFHGNLKNYICNLQVGGTGFTHVHSIRNIYLTFPDCPVKFVYLALLQIYRGFVKDDEIQQLVENTTYEIENDHNYFIERISDLYVNNIDNLETTAMIKMAQLKIQSKKSKKKIKQS